MEPTLADLGAGDARPAQLHGGQLLSAISNGIVKLSREHYGRGPIRAKTYTQDDTIVCVLRDAGFTPLEQTLMDSGEPERVVAMRADFQHIMASRYTRLVEELTNRKVLAFLSTPHVEPDITLDVFFIDHALDSHGAAAVIDAGTRQPKDLASALERLYALDGPS